MNRQRYRLVFSQSVGGLVPAAESTRGRGKSASGAVWLDKRPTPGVWAGLYCLPVFDSFEALVAAVSPEDASLLQDGEVFKHVLTHKDLHLHPVRLVLPKPVSFTALASISINLLICFHLFDIAGISCCC